LFVTVFTRLTLHPNGAGVSINYRGFGKVEFQLNTSSGILLDLVLQWSQHHAKNLVESN